MKNRGKRKTWFVLDELASLQRLPQLTTAVTENQKVQQSDGARLPREGPSGGALRPCLRRRCCRSPRRRSFSRRVSPVLRSGFRRPLARSRLNVSGRRERMDSSRAELRKRTTGHHAGAPRHGVGGAGLDPLHGYMKHGNLVLPMRFPYLESAEQRGEIRRAKTQRLVPSPAMAKPEPIVGRAAARGDADGIHRGSRRRPRKQLRNSPQVNEQGIHTSSDDHGDDLETYQRGTGAGVSQAGVRER